MLLVGVIGKYEYMDYVKRIGHNKEIEFNCDKGYKRIGNVLHELNRTLNNGTCKNLYCNDTKVKCTRTCISRSLANEISLTARAC